MNSFFQLVGFEYKKILKRKSTLAAVVLIGILIASASLSSVTGKSYWHSDGNNISSFEAMKKDREVRRSTAGVIDEDYIVRAIQQNALMIADDNNYFINNYGRFLKSSAYIKYALPYENAVNIINVAYESNFEAYATDGFYVFNSMTTPIDTLELKDVKNFYPNIQKQALYKIATDPALTQAEFQKHTEMLEKVSVPFKTGYSVGYEKFLSLFDTVGLFVLLSVAICVAPVFAIEYQTKTDQLILSSKYGKNKVIWAKIFTGLSFTLIFSVITIFVFLFTVLVLLGFDGGNVSIQVINPLTTYPMTIFKACIVLSLVTVLASLMFSMIAMVFSAVLKSSFGVIIVSFMFLFLPAFIVISPINRLPYRLLQLFPIKMMSFSGVFSQYLFNIWGTTVTPAVFYSVFCIIVTVLVMPFAYGGFKNHQVG
ncbi:ABC transporter permease [Alkaliphilus peptidifermentans]|uniref:ABC-2 family transporter protein n=1 Tax=Alkaliphilus peptidifermentans DSM 18978 TaxID=1120976 RepID=A0A1G5IQZ8_9FIRM|nr:ABC transporter permease subunit [Alkaliphilus peptidifermentans]SCY78525.1 hypothetical protein SAMN03080606_02475 [Alkaliphilus peptidifermentans DSM 18978]